MKKVAIHNLGCKVNSYEAESMEQMLRAAGYSIVPFDENVPQIPPDASQGKEDEPGCHCRCRRLLCTVRQ